MPVGCDTYGVLTQGYILRPLMGSWTLLTELIRC